MALHYAHRTRRGTFYIRPMRGGWGLFFADEHFDGPFASAHHALEQLVGGHCAWPSCGDPSVLGLSDALSDWIALM